MRHYDEWDLDELSHLGFHPLTRARAVRELEVVADRQPELRADALVRLAAVWDRAGDDEAAEVVLRQAVAEGGEAPLDARAAYGSFLLDRGRRPEAEAMFDAAVAARPLDTAVYEVAGEAWEAAGELEEALRWFNAGYTRVEHLGRGAFLRTGRWRVRRALGWPEDALDLQDVADRALLSSRDSEPDDLDGRTVSMAMFIAADDWEAWQDLWPGRRQADHLAHRTALERRLCSLPAGRERRCVVLDSSALREFAVREGLDPTDTRTRSAYGEELLHAGGGVVWPPQRNAPCWCGSGAKYKKCCQPLGR